MMADGYGFGGEGDLISAMATRMFHLLNPPISFREIFSTDYRGNALLFSHMGEANVAMAKTDRKVPLVARPTPITRTQNRQLALVTVFEPGTVTLAALVQCRNRWKLITALMQIEEFGPLPALCVPHSKVKVNGDVRQFLTDYAKAGGTHHNALLRGDARARLRILAELEDMDYVEIHQ
jgi:L-arabinose isomerase